MHIQHVQVFAALANEARLRCLQLVARNGEVCVCEVVEALGISQPSASKALNALKSAGLLQDRREANWSYYALASSMPDWVSAVIAASSRDLASSPGFIADQKRFLRLDLRRR
ncbi:MAG: metalloregulator ArsR/SmtB family transcription factor [Gammaproteobacteria bacterium]